MLGMLLLMINPFLYTIFYMSVFVWIKHKKYLDYLFVLSFSVILLNFPIHYDTINNFKKMLWLKKENNIKNLFDLILKSKPIQVDYYIYIYILILVSLYIWIRLYRKYSYLDTYLTVLLFLNLPPAYLLDQNRFYLATLLYIFGYTQKKNIFTGIACLFHEYFLLLYSSRKIIEYLLKKMNRFKIKSKECINVTIFSILLTVCLVIFAKNLTTEKYILKKFIFYILNPKWGVFTFTNIDWFLFTNRILTSLLIYLLMKIIKDNQSEFEPTEILEIKSHIYIYIGLICLNTFTQRNTIIIIYILYIKISNLVKKRLVNRIKKWFIFMLFFLNYILLLYVPVNLLINSNKEYFKNEIIIKIFKSVSTNNYLDYLIGENRYSDDIILEGLGIE